MKRMLMALGALMLSGLVHADLSTLAVQFTPNATQYNKGDVVNVAATSNGTNAQYRFILEKVDVGVVAVSSSSWSANSSYLIDTFSVNMPAGKYRLRVLVRETANKPEILTKYEFFTVVVPAPPAACDLIDGKTYTNASATTIIGGNLSLADMLAGVSITTAGGSGGISSVSFVSVSGDAGVVEVNVEPVSVSVCVFICIALQVIPDPDIAGTYTCSGNTVTITAAGIASGDASLVSLMGGSVPVTVSGSMTVNTATDTLTAGGRTFE